MIQITPEEVIEFVRARGSLELPTGTQRKLFTVRLNGNELEFVPHSTHKPRMHELKWFRLVCDRFSQTNSYRPTDYIELTVNTSYSLALIEEYLNQTLRELRPTSFYERALRERIRKSAKDSSEARRERLTVAPKMAPKKLAVTQVYLRNTDVIVEVLLRANGFCEKCGKPAPFRRKSDGTPYLEVHHKRLLADGGEDTIENAIALCPNCHRDVHYG